MKKTLVNLLKFGISGGIIAYLVYYARQDDHFAELAAGHKDWGLLAAAWAVSMAAVLVTIVRWYVLVRALALPFTLKDAFRLGFLGYLFNFVSVGSVGGDLFKAIFIAREQPGRRAEAIATVVIDRIIGLLGLFVVASASLLATGQLHSPVGEIQIICRATLIATGVAAAGTLMVLTPGFTSGAFSEFLGSLPRVGPTLHKLIGALRVYRRRPGVLLLTGLMSVGVHALATLGIYLVARGLPGVAPSLKAHFVAVPLAIVTGLLPLPMSGLGAFEGALEFLYQHLPAAEPISAGKGLVVALGYRAITVAIAVVGVVYYLGSRREVVRALEEAKAAERAAGGNDAIVRADEGPVAAVEERSGA